MSRPARCWSGSALSVRRPARQLGPLDVHVAPPLHLKVRQYRCLSCLTIPQGWSLMAEEYQTRGTSQHTADVNDIELTPTHPVQNPRSRRIVRSKLVRNIHDADQAVEITIMHQRRHSSREPWRDVESFNLGT